MSRTIVFLIGYFFFCFSSYAFENGQEVFAGSVTLEAGKKSPEVVVKKVKYRLEVSAERFVSKERTDWTARLVGKNGKILDSVNLKFSEYKGDIDSSENNLTNISGAYQGSWSKFLFSENPAAEKIEILFKGKTIYKILVSSIK